MKANLYFTIMRGEKNIGVTQVQARETINIGTV
jgi:hypothetical protein